MKPVSLALFVIPALVHACSPAGKHPESAGDLPKQHVAKAPAPVEMDASIKAKKQSDPLNLRILNLTWYQQAEILCDRTTFTEAFKEMGYEPPAGSYLLAARIVDGGDQPAFQYYSLGDTAFQHSDGRYWPASTVKLMAAVGALHTLAKHGLTGETVLEFTDALKRYKGTAATLYQGAITRSNNLAYDRLVIVAGFDELNSVFFSPENGFPFMKLQCPYYPGGEQLTLRSSPVIRYTQGDLEGEIPARSSEQVFDECPADANCITLFELLDGLRRVMLHRELPKRDRFNLHKRDVKRLQEYLHQSRNKLEPAASKALGHPVRIYNKAGRVPGADQNEHALVIDEVTGERYLVAVSVPDTLRSDEATEEQVRTLAARALKVLSKQPTNIVSLRRGGGVSIDVQTSIPHGDSVYTITVKGDGAERLRLWRNRELIAESGSAHLETQLELPPKSQSHLLVALLEQKGKITDYQIVAISR